MSGAGSWWEPLAVADVVELFAGAPFRWWVGGGRALELHAGRSWRDHDDTDVGMVRSDVPALATVLAGWDVHVAAAGRLTPWDGRPLRAEAGREENNLWCRRSADGPWCLDVTVGAGDAAAWASRRDPRLRVPWADAVLRTAEGVPYLAPELQLLFKAKAPRPKDEADARAVVPLLTAERRWRLAQLLPPGHPWAGLAASPCSGGP